MGGVDRGLDHFLEQHPGDLAGGGIGVEQTIGVRGEPGHGYVPVGAGPVEVRTVRRVRRVLSWRGAAVLVGCNRLSSMLVATGPSCSVGAVKVVQNLGMFHEACQRFATSTGAEATFTGAEATFSSLSGASFEIQKVVLP